MRGGRERAFRCMGASWGSTGVRLPLVADSAVEAAEAAAAACAANAAWRAAFFWARAERTGTTFEGVGAGTGLEWKGRVWVSFQTKGSDIDDGRGHPGVQSTARGSQDAASSSLVLIRLQSIPSSPSYQHVFVIYTRQNTDSHDILSRLSNLLSGDGHGLLGNFLVLGLFDFLLALVLSLDLQTIKGSRVLDGVSTAAGRSRGGVLALGGHR
jgi:hypothetical protein